MSAASWLVIGGNSDIALAVLRQIQPDSAGQLTLLGRNEAELERRQADLKARLNCTVDIHACDLLSTDSVRSVIDNMEAPDVVLVAAGELLDTADLQREPDRLQSTLRTNFEALVLILDQLGPRMAGNGGGSIIVLNSVAGLRGRPSNYVYGATKAALTTYVEGFRLHWQDSGLALINVLTGMVDTKMTAGRDLPSMLLANTQDVARSIHLALIKQRKTVYVPWYWRWVMLVIRFAPSVIVKRL